MRKLIIIAAVAIVGASVVGAQAQCSFDGPAKAKGVKSSLVRAFAGCPSITFLGPNSSTGGGTPSCSPPFAHSSYLFDDKKGKCDFKTSAKKEEPCSDLSGSPCMNLSIQAKCSGITRNDGVTPISGITDTGWSVSTISRATLNDNDNGDMTIINFPVQIAFPTPSSGKLSVKTSTNEILAGLGIAALPGCAQVEIVTLAIQDPAGSPFAVQGAGTR